MAPQIQSERIKYRKQEWMLHKRLAAKRDEFDCTNNLSGNTNKRAKFVTTAQYADTNARKADNRYQQLKTK